MKKRNSYVAITYAVKNREEKFPDKKIIYPIAFLKVSSVIALAKFCKN